MIDYKQRHNILFEYIIKPNTYEFSKVKEYITYSEITRVKRGRRRRIRYA